MQRHITSSAIISEFKRERQAIARHNAYEQNGEYEIEYEIDMR